MSETFRKSDIAHLMIARKDELGGQVQGYGPIRMFHDYALNLFFAKLS
jgi:hypothetical protein